MQAIADAADVDADPAVVDAVAASIQTVSQAGGML